MKPRKECCSGEGEGPIIDLVIWRPEEELAVREEGTGPEVEPGAPTLLSMISSSSGEEIMSGGWDADHLSMLAHVHGCSVHDCVAVSK